MTVLNFLSQSDEFVTQASVAKMADMDVMSVSQIIRGLEGKGFLMKSIISSCFSSSCVS
jgi:DNA-binding MarR family transcriptional regulator